MSTRAWRAITYEGVRGPSCEAVLRFAVVLWLRDPGHGLMPEAEAKLRSRMQDPAPCTATQHAWLVPRLLAWSQGKGCHATLVKGLRGVVDDRFLPEEDKNI